MFLCHNIANLYETNSLSSQGGGGLLYQKDRVLIGDFEKNP